MKENYIRRVKRELFLPRVKRNEIIRDLREIFSSALEHGETEERVIERLGSPRNYADGIQEQFGINCAQRRKRRACIQIGAALAAALAALAAGILLRFLRVPENMIGQASAVTTIQVNGSAVDLQAILLLFGAAALATVIFLIARYAAKNQNDRRR